MPDEVLPLALSMRIEAGGWDAGGAGALVRVEDARGGEVAEVEIPCNEDVEVAEVDWTGGDLTVSIERMPVAADGSSYEVGADAPGVDGPGDRAPADGVGVSERDGSYRIHLGPESEGGAAVLVVTLDKAR